MNRFRLWFKAVRAYAYSASVVPVAIGGLHARWTGEAFSLLRFGAALAGGVLLHTAANLWNDYYDFRGGVDREGGGIGSGVLVHGELTPRQVFRGAAVCAALGCGIGVWLVVQAGWGLLLLLGAGLVGAWAYSAGPFSPKHRALGEVWVFLLMGVGMTLGGHMAQTGSFSWSAIATSIPAGLLMTLILYTNNLRDLESDRAAGLHTLPMLFTATEAKVLAGVFLALAYASTCGLAAVGRIPPAAQLSLLTIPVALRWYLRVWKGILTDAQVVGMAQLHMVFGLLFAAGLWWGGGPV